MTDFSKLLIRQYKYWGVYVHENQGYLGRCVVWCDRADAKQLTDATGAEFGELFSILRELQSASATAFGGEWFNFAFLGNETPHLHCHFIPRYSTEKEFEGTTFKDERWGHNYRTDHSFVTPPEIIEKVRQKMADALANEVAEKERTITKKKYTAFLISFVIPLFTAFPVLSPTAPGSNGELGGPMFLFLFFILSLFVPASIIGVGYGKKYQEIAMLGALASTALIGLTAVLYYQYHVI